MDSKLRRSVIISNPQGLHMRPAAAFAELAGRFDSCVTVIRGEQSVDGKNWVELLLLAAEAGTVLVLEVSGRDADRALESLSAQLSAASIDDARPGSPH